MSVTSYAQNFEDVILLRALRHIERGFYIDIGAQDPIKYSVTKTFYELGWRGINIEPVGHWFRLLEQDRVHDTNLNVAVSDTPGSLRLYEVLDTGLSTTEEVYARRHTEAGFDVQEIDVPCVTLDSICAVNVAGEVHFLKVDCEGAETSALRGFSFDKVRPWIIVVEATEPMSQKPAYAEWEPILLDHAYQFVYADGLNRFYLANEHCDLAWAFELPPNVFDAFVPAEVADAIRRLELAQSHLKMMADVERAVRAENERDRVQEQLAQSLKNAEHFKVELGQKSAELERAVTELGQKSVELERAVTELGWLYGDLQQAQSDLGATAGSTNALTLEIDRLRVQLRDMDVGLRVILASKSWRYTSPMRMFMSMVRGNIGGREAARRVVTRVAGKLARGRRTRGAARVLLFPFPSLRDRLRGVAKRGLGIEQLAPVAGGAAQNQRAAEIVLSRSGIEALSILQMERDRKSMAIK